MRLLHHPDTPDLHWQTLHRGAIDLEFNVDIVRNETPLFNVAEAAAQHFPKLESSRYYAKVSNAFISSTLTSADVFGCQRTEEPTRFLRPQRFGCVFKTRRVPRVDGALSSRTVNRQTNRYTC